MEIVDTQIVIDAFRGMPSRELTGRRISSVTASEFLRIYVSSLTEAAYYVPFKGPGLRSSIRAGVMTGRPVLLQHPVRKTSTDQIIMQFGGRFPTVVEYGSLALAEAINKRSFVPIDQGLAFLGKRLQKTLRDRFHFLLDSDLTCVPLGRDIVTASQALLAEFARLHTLKSSFRNTWNDMLIASTALKDGDELVTRDSLLLRFVSSHLCAAKRKEGANLVIDFGTLKKTKQRVAQESKGYINRGWIVQFLRNH